MGIQEALAHLRKDIKEAFEYDTKLEGISTGSIAIDRIVGNGGFPRGRISEVFGWESSGKSTLCLSACAQAQRKGLYAAYLDPERGIDLQHAKRIGFNYEDESKGVYITPFSFEETSQASEELIQSGGLDLLIVDSVPGMVPKKMLEGDIEDTYAGGLGLQSRMMAQFLSRIVKAVAEKNVAMVLVNQMRAKINTGPGAQWEPKEQSAGGSALKFYTSLRVDLENSKKEKEKRPNPITGKEEDVVVGSIHKAHAFKNKVAIPYRNCEFYIKYDELMGIYGIDNLRTIIEMAVGMGVVKQGGAGYFSYKGKEHEFQLRGTKEVYTHLMRNAEILQEIKASVLASRSLEQPE